LRASGAYGDIEQALVPVVLAVNRALAGHHSVHFDIRDLVRHKVRGRIALLLQDGEITIELIRQNLNERRLCPCAQGENGRKQQRNDNTHVVKDNADRTAPRKANFQTGTDTSPRSRHTLSARP